MHKWVFPFFSLLLLLVGCCTPRSAAYQEYYAHIDLSLSSKPLTRAPFFIVFLVDAPHLDYTDNKSFLRTMAKHPSNCSKEGDVGHAWIYLHGTLDGNCHVLEGGHSGERGFCQPRYFEGIMQQMDEGCQNPISYLWESQNDGFFQIGNGGHRPTFAAKVNLTEDQYTKICRFIKHYSFHEYALTGNQCASFVAQIGALINFPIECHQTVMIDSDVCIGGDDLHLWNDPIYSSITIATPDVIEKSLILAVYEGRAENALYWYINKNKHSFKRRIFLTNYSQLDRYLYFYLCN